MANIVNLSTAEVKAQQYPHLVLCISLIFISTTGLLAYTSVNESHTVLV